MPTNLGMGAGLEFPKIGGVVTDGLLAWWKHNEGSGATLYDYYKGNNGVIRGSSFWDNNGPDGYPVGTYDGTNNDINEIGITLTLALRPGFVSGTKYVLCKGSADADNYIIMQDDDEIWFFYSDENTGFVHYYATSSLNLIINTWVILTISFTFGTGSSAAWYSGDTLLTASWLAGDGDNLVEQISLDDYVHIGSLDNTDDDSGKYWPYLGRMGDILLYSKALNSIEVAQNFNTLRGRYSL